ncbi:hypothetical protein [Sphingomonas sp. Y38-1Y]|nr:hypothetical protein [Sphingomonas sp. Y38-1Y]
MNIAWASLAMLHRAPAMAKRRSDRQDVWHLAVAACSSVQAR